MRKDYNLEKRKFVIGGFIVLIVAIYLVRLFNLQVVETKYKENAESNAFMRKTLHPSRGLIYDRNGKLVVFNRPTYDLMMIPRDVQPFDTLAFCDLLQITRAEFDKHLRDMRDPHKNHNYSSYTEQIFMQQLSPEIYGRVQEKIFQFPGFFITQRIIREYNYEVGANVLGNIRQVNERDIERDEYYQSGDYTGDLGVEKSYEKYLRGQKGLEVLVRDASGKVKGKYQDGAQDIAPIAGYDIKLSVDIDLQGYAERLLQGKQGAVVAIEPSTGEVLACVTSPNYMPSLLVGKERGNNYAKLVADKGKPLFDRAVMAAYPPGSTFKPTQGLIFLQEGIADANNTYYPCHGGFISKGIKIKCHGHGSPISLKPALETSCNAYFCWGLKNMLENKTKYGDLETAFTKWKDYMVSQGYGYRLGLDMPGESRGFIPNAAYYDKMIGKDKWVANSILSISIGQGEVLATPLQIANLAATIGNRGYYITPHVVKNIIGLGVLKKSVERHNTLIDSRYYEDVVQGMRMAVTGGTCRGANIPGLDVCGKTGTAQNPHGRDHSVFMGFAPMNNPQIAICVYVENAGFGAQVAVPIGSMIIERYLRGGYADNNKNNPEEDEG